jgi:hypothetical protein
MYRGARILPPHLDTFAHCSSVVFPINPARKHTFDKHFDKLSDHSVQRSTTGGGLDDRALSGHRVILPRLDTFAHRSSWFLPINPRRKHSTTGGRIVSRCPVPGVWCLSYFRNTFFAKTASSSSSPLISASFFLRLQFCTCFSL